MKPGYEAFKRLVAQPLGQAAIPSNKLLYFHERIFVYVTDGELKTDHSFSLAGQRFLTLHYEIDRLAAASS